MAVQFVFPGQQRVSINGSPLANYRLYFYEPGTTTPKDVFSDDELVTPISQPVVADSSGVWQRIFCNGKYKVALKTAADADVTTWDDFDPGLSTALGTSEALPVSAGGTGSTTAAGARASLGAASQASVTQNTTDITELDTLVTTGLHSDGDRFGALATLDDITGSSEFTTDGFKATNPFGAHLLHVRDEQTANTAGGTFTSGSFVKRTLNTTKTNEITGASIASSVITLPAGTYYIRASAPCVGPNTSSTEHKLKLRNTSDGSDALIGTSEFSSGDGAPSQTRAWVEGRFTIAAQKNFELQHRTANTRNTDGLGRPANMGVVEVYADCLIWKVA
jgi:hypothetical protein